ncbi:UDP-glucuronic acid decarboxylase family protein [Cumulibacter manganitolerans]|uniref:UDP-glucuronic acid decarboxylase family protein n=1 Tax=Cumulibacter manganitolerans TaxID=1884992 RepID=UPI00129505CE|nr:UDP-glucuronic acid decarboxylase family protein [Cumulibacter manganitolerans]
MTAAGFEHALVTGGAGFIGSHLCTALREEGVRVTAVDNLLSGTLANVAHLRSDPDFVLLRADVTEELHVAEPVDLVLHLASLASPVDYQRLPLETMRVGATGTERMLELARAMDARFVLASTSEVYGDPLEHPQPETYWGNVNPVGPRSMYDESKRYAEALTMAYHRTHGVRTGICRIFNTYGPAMRPSDGRAVPTFVRQALAGEPLTVSGDGSQTRSVTYVDDLVRGILMLAASDAPGPVNLGNPRELTVLQLAQDVIEAVGSPSRIEFIERPADDPTVRCPDIAQARDLLGWEPRIAWEEGLRRMLASIVPASDTVYDRAGSST